MYQPTMKARMTELEQRRAEIEARLAEAPADVPDIHPNIAELYRAKVIRLSETLANPEANGNAREDIRSLVGEVVIAPGDRRGETNATLRGELMGILDLVSGQRRSVRPDVITKGAAGPRFAPATSRPGVARLIGSPRCADAGAQERERGRLGSRDEVWRGSSEFRNRSPLG
jgi:hypothetical protein